MANQLTAQQRAQLFMASTRETVQTLPTQSVTAENSTVQFQLPKTRLLSKIWLEVQAVATLKTTGAETSVTVDAFTPYQVLRSVSLDLNNGFMPFKIPGRDLSLLSYVRLHPSVIAPQANPNIRNVNYVQNTVSTGGTDNTIKFMVELPLTLNDRDPVGLVMLQNPNTNVVLSVDVATLAQAYALTGTQTCTFKSMSITPVLQTFTIPPTADAIPDLSVLKLVSSTNNMFAGNGQNIVKLQVGTIYRKLLLYFADSNNNPLADSDFTGNIELVFNQADVPYAIKPSALSALNASQLGVNLPTGAYLFDFSYQGIPNLGGSRDYIDSENLTEFWVRFTSTKAGTVTAVTETLSRLS